jgi:hypothetical protein
MRDPWTSDPCFHCLLLTLVLQLVGYVLASLVEDHMLQRVSICLAWSIIFCF